MAIDRREAVSEHAAWPKAIASGAGPVLAHVNGPSSAPPPPPADPRRPTAIHPAGRSQGLGKLVPGTDGPSPTSGPRLPGVEIALAKTPNVCPLPVAAWLVEPSLL